MMKIFDKIKNFFAEEDEYEIVELEQAEEEAVEAEEAEEEAVEAEVEAEEAEEEAEEEDDEEDETDGNVWSTGIWYKRWYIKCANFWYKNPIIKKIIVATVALFLLILLAIGLKSCINRINTVNVATTTEATTITTTETTTEATTAEPTTLPIFDKVEDMEAWYEAEMAKKGNVLGVDYFEGEGDSKENVDPEKDKSDPGTLAFNPKNIKTLADLEKFFKCGSPEARASMDLYIAMNAERSVVITDEQIQNASSWRVYQIGRDEESFYKANTAYVQGKGVVEVGEKEAKAGDIYFIFGVGIPICTRGACMNPQKEIPIPPNNPAPTTTKSTTKPSTTKPTTTKEPTTGEKVTVPSTTVPTTTKPSTTLKPKDPHSDPWTQGNAPTGGGPNNDPGPGEYIPPESMTRPPATSRVNPPAPTRPPSTTVSSTTVPSTTKPHTTVPSTTKPATTIKATTSPQETVVNTSKVTYPWDR